jgi:DNA-binding CsgD family transcriptional regulator
MGFDKRMATLARGRGKRSHACNAKSVHQEVYPEVPERFGELAYRVGDCSDSREPASAHLSFAKQQAESARLRIEFLRNAIELALTMAGFCDARPHSDRLRSASTRMAQKSYQTILSMWETAASNQANFAELNPRLEMLRQALQGDTDGNSHTVTGLPAVKAEAPEATPPPVFRELLTAREMEVLRLVASGHSTKETAHLLGMSFKTAACHRYRLMDKLAIHDTASLVRYAIREKLVEP